MFGLPPLPRTLSAALTDVGDGRRAVRDAALKDLGRLAAEEPRTADGDRAFSELVRLVTESSRADVRGEAALVLADVGDREAVPALLAAARDENVRVREMALLALGEIVSGPDPAVLEVVERALCSPHVELRFQALAAAGRVMSDETLVSTLVQSIAGADAQIRYRAVRVADERWLGDAQPESAPRAIVTLFEEALADRVLDVRVAAALALLKLRGAASVAGDPASSQVLLDGLAASKLEPEDEEAVIDAVGAAGLVRGTRELERKAWGIVPGRFAWQARIALARLGDTRARAFLVKELGARRREARILAVVAVGRARLVEARAELERMRGASSDAERDAIERALADLAG